MKNKKNIFYFFENIISYDNDISKIFSKKDNFIPIINSKKSTYYNKNKKNYFNLSFGNIFIPIVTSIFIQIIILFLIKKLTSI